MTISEYDARLLDGYKKAPYLLHFQFGQGGYVHRYALVETIKVKDVKRRTKQKQSELGMTQEQIWQSYNIKDVTDAS